MALQSVMVFSRFERFWHWFQAVLIIALMMTGFEVNGAYEWLGYETAAQWHRWTAWVLIWLWVFAIFWHLITGEWKQYIPTPRGMVEVIRYYSVGIFDPTVSHPYKKTRLAKHNPVQRVAYSAFNILITPIIWITGLLYMFYNDWDVVGLDGGAITLAGVALVHTAAAFAMLVFFIGHVYMAGFTAKPFYGYIKSMITGYEHVEVDEPARTGAPPAE
ncbi:cytochrome b/b6 domain-containing protein [Roseospira navarrensis]|uniref:cytochrome b/b6 domain-containing protein n=1 Tax=Roseospira navarrensis TaxID=140058 RepID=UPI001FE42BBE|nr:cytochrome b/b6 domain-containing protein [Roseospira navarrensis]